MYPRGAVQGGSPDRGSAGGLCTKGPMTVLMEDVMRGSNLLKYEAAQSGSRIMGRGRLTARKLPKYGPLVIAFVLAVICSAPAHAQL